MSEKRDGFMLGMMGVWFGFGLAVLLRYLLSSSSLAVLLIVFYAASIPTTLLIYNRMADAGDL